MTRDSTKLGRLVAEIRAVADRLDVVRSIPRDDHPTIVAWDPIVAARLQAELREDDARMTPGPWRDQQEDDETRESHEVLDCEGFRVPSGSKQDAVGIARLRNNAREVADQLEAARAEIASARELIDSEVHVAFARMMLSEVDGMRALVAVVERWNDDGKVGDDAVHSAVATYRDGARSDLRIVATRGEVDFVARMMIAEWERVEREKVNISRVATFADMARVVIERAILSPGVRPAAGADLAASSAVVGERGVGGDRSGDAAVDLADLNHPNQVTLLGSAMREAARMHANERFPNYEYATTRGPRHDFDEAPPDGDGWQRNTSKGSEGWDRFDDHEEAYWYRRRTRVDDK